MNMPYRGLSRWRMESCQTAGCRIDRPGLRLQLLQTVQMLGSLAPASHQRKGSSIAELMPLAMTGMASTMKMESNMVKTVTRIRANEKADAANAGHRGARYPSSYLKLLKNKSRATHRSSDSNKRMTSTGAPWPKCSRLISSML